MRTLILRIELLSLGKFKCNELTMFLTDVLSDAAHTIHPLAGQGLNQGQADVAALVKAIEAAVLCGQDIGAELSLESYNADRYAANNAIMGVCDKLHKLYAVESG